MDRGDPGDILGGGPIGGPFMSRSDDRQSSTKFGRAPTNRATRSRLAIGTAAAAGAVLLVSMVLGTVASASTPTTLGYRDFGYGGALASRATSDPEQSKLWYADGAWWGGLFVSSGSGSGGSHYNIFKFNPGTHAWVDTTRQIDIRDLSHGDYLWDGAHNKLYVASSKSICVTAPAPPSQGCNDAVRVYRYNYNPAAATLATRYTLDPGFPKTLIGGPYLTTGAPYTGGGSNAVTIAIDGNGELWLAYTRDDPTCAAPPCTTFKSNVYLAHSADGVTWSIPTHFAGADLGVDQQHNTAALVSFGTSVGLYWTDKHLSGESFGYFSVHASGDPVSTWSARETVTHGVNYVDDQVNLKADATQHVYAIVKTDMVDQVKLFDRAPGSPGTWTSHPVWTSANGNTRAQVVIDDEHGVAYAFSSSASDSTPRSIYVKSAPLTTLTFPTGKGAAFIRSATDSLIDDVTLTKHAVGSSTGIVAEASDSGTKWFLHGEMALPSADTTAPTGTVAINAGAEATAVAAVTLNLTASDVGGIGVNQVRVANTGGVDGNGVLNGAGAANFSWATTVPWTLSAGDGTKTVYVQFQDGAGNWSQPAVSDDITLDTTGPDGTVTINDGDPTSSDTAVTLDVPATDDNSDVSFVRIANAPTVTGGVLSDASAVTSAYASTKTWTLAAGIDGPRSVYVQWQDSLGNWSGVETDDIDVHDTTPPVGTVVVNGGAPGVHSLSVNLNFPNTSADVTNVDISNEPTMTAKQNKLFAASIPWTLTGPLTNGALKTVYVVFRDGAGNESAHVSGQAYSASVTVKVDLTRPVMHGVIAPYFYPSTMSGNSASLHLLWPAATDTITGVASYRIWSSTDGHPFVSLGATVAPARAFNVPVFAGHTYRFRVYAVDRAGNASLSLYTPVMRDLGYQDANRNIVYSRGWHSSISPAYYGGTDRYTTARSATARLTFVGRSVAWVSALGPTRGSARVYVDGRLIATVNLYSATPVVRRIVFARHWSSARTHTIRVIVLGTAGHPRVDLDAFIVLR
jgi:hypothetical protein